LKAISDNLSAAVESANADELPDQTHKEALKAAAQAASSALLQIVEPETQ
jgi:hypothetical protein